MRNKLDGKIFDNPWFRKLPVKHKNLWFYLICRADPAGVLDFDPEMVSFYIGEEVGWEDLKGFGERVEKISEDKIWLTGFIKFQHRELNRKSNVHAPVFRSIEKHGLEDKVGLKKTKKPPKKKKAVAPERPEKPGEVKEERSLINQVVDYLNERTGKSYTTINKATRKYIIARSKEGASLEDFKKVIDNKVMDYDRGDFDEKYLRPSTLFSSTKFEGYLNQSGTKVIKETNFNEENQKRLDRMLE